MLDNGLENALIGRVVDSIPKWRVNSVIFSGSHTNITQLTGSGKVFAVLVEGNRHNAVSCVECLLDTITVMHVDINIQDTLLES